jgi:hypothetical protein
VEVRVSSFANSFFVSTGYFPTLDSCPLYESSHVKVS